MDIERRQMLNLYDDLTNCVYMIKKSPNNVTMEDFKNCLAKLFPDATPVKAVYTQNIDKLGFYVFVFPHIDGDDVKKVLFDGEKLIVKKYDIELDSKLFDPALGLTTNEIAALIFHDVFAMVSDASPAMKVRNWLDNYLIEKNEILKIPELVQYRNILAYGFAESMRKVTSIFEKDHYTDGEEVRMIDEYLGDNLEQVFSKDIISAFNKIDRMGANYNRENTDKFITMKWVLRIYNNIALNRIPGIMGIRRCIEISASKIERRELKNFAARISRIDDEDLLTESAVEYNNTIDEDMLKNMRDSFISFHNSFDDLDDAEDDYLILMNKAEQASANEPDAIPDLVNEINKKMSCIQDYVDCAGGLTKSDLTRWKTMFKNYDTIRRNISSNKPSLFPSDRNSYLRKKYNNKDIV